jgi:hypothetical protein
MQRKLIVILSLAWATSCAAQAAKQTDIVFSFDAVEDMVRPESKAGISVHHDYKITLLPDGRVEEAQSWQRSNTPNGSDKRTAQLGKTRPSYLWRVLSGNKLVRAEAFPQSSRFVTISLISENKCVAEVKEELKPGFKEFAYGGGDDKRYFSRYEITNTSCEIH